MNADKVDGYILTRILCWTFNWIYMYIILNVQSTRPAQENSKRKIPAFYAVGVYSNFPSFDIKKFFFPIKSEILSNKKNAFKFGMLPFCEGQNCKAGIKVAKKDEI